MTDNSLREYYIKLQNLYTNGVNILTALNQSLTTNASEVSINIINDNDVSESVKIPSFLYLDSKLEQLETTINNLFDMPNSGEAWFNNIGNMYKLQLVKSNVAPLKPGVELASDVYAHSTLNTFLKDLVTPRVSLRLNIPNLPNNITEMYMKKLVIYDDELYSMISNVGDSLSYDDVKSLLYNYNINVDYEEYDSTLKLPVKNNKFKSQFKINSIINNNVNIDRTYKIELDTVLYSNIDNSTATYKLGVGDTLCIGKELAIYKVEYIDYSTDTVIIKEEVGHVALQPYFENAEMYFEVYNFDYTQFKYVDIPLEENPYICVFLGTIYNGVRSELSNAMFFNLYNIHVANENGDILTDRSGNAVSYIEYYNTFCVNIGDLILGLTQTAYPQLSNFTNKQLNNLTESELYKSLVNQTLYLNDANVLSVVPINNHIYEDGIVKRIKEYHSQKNSIQAELATITENINTSNNTLLTTDWSLETDITQNNIQAQLKGYYTERLTLEKQLNGIVNELNKLTKENNVNEFTKYRIRGVTNVNDFETYINSDINKKVKIIGIDVEYKYKSVSKETTELNNINNSVFTDWNKMQSIERQRKLTFDEDTLQYYIDFVNYDNIANIIKWNQLDIPITTGEDVVIRIRYKYNIGQPFIDLYSPWSDEITMSFPTEYIEQIELPTIINENENDVYEARFTGKLINDGYEDHITNNLIVSNQIFYHMPENIYSGFNTGENNMLSLKDKLNQMCEDIRGYADLVESESQKKMSVFLQYDGKTIELFNNTTNKINLYNTEHINTTFVKNEMNIIIKNTGEVPLNLYSIFPGQTDVPLMHCNYDYYFTRKKAYEHYPLLMDGEINAQTLGQWIYFREINPYTGKSILYQGNKQEDKNNYGQAKTVTTDGLNSNIPVINQDNVQLGLPFIKQKDDIKVNNFYGFLNIADSEVTINNAYNMTDEFDNDPIIYYSNKDNDKANISLAYKYEDYWYITEENNKEKTVYLDNKTSISDWISAGQKANHFNGLQENKFTGAFLYVNLDNKTSLITKGGEKDNYEIKVGESVSVPVVFEYFFYNGNNADSKDKLVKTIMFDIRNSLINNPLNYILEITANNITNLSDIEYNSK